MRVLSASILLIAYFLSFSFNTEVFPHSFHNSFTEPTPAAADTLVKMERTVCFGTCPSYELVIYGNGQVVFEGNEFVERKGTTEGEISMVNLNSLIQVIREISFMEIPSDPECESWMTDHPSVFLTVEIGDERNSITHYQGCKGFEYEDELYRLETAIDSLAGTQKWIGEE